MADTFFAESFGLFTENPDGHWKMIGDRLRNVYTGQVRRVWRVAPGMLSKRSLAPSATGYILDDGRLIPSKDGSTIVDGSYPVYWIKGTSQPVYLDHDGSMVFEPVNFIDRTRRAYYDRQTTNRAKRRVVYVKKNRRGGFYVWFVRQHDGRLATGVGKTRQQAYDAAKNWLLTNRNDGPYPDPNEANT